MCGWPRSSLSGSREANYGQIMKITNIGARDGLEPLQWDAVRERLDPWGPVPAPALQAMRALKHEFDPRGVLNPGRFVGGL